MIVLSENRGLKKSAKRKIGEPAQKVLLKISFRLTVFLLKATLMITELQVFLCVKEKFLNMAKTVKSKITVTFMKILFPGSWKNSIIKKMKDL